MKLTVNIVILDYGMGNIKSIKSVLKYIGVTDIKISNHHADIEGADKLILPGVGAFNEAINNIKQKNLENILTETVMIQKKPILGICLGMQLMCRSSDENGKNDGLGFIEAEVTRFESGIKVPHVGFNQVAIKNNLKLYHEMSGVMDFYFTHSFKMNSESNINQCECEYGEYTFIASFEVDNIAGVQFHPELSQTNGIKLIKNFVEKL